MINRIKAHFRVYAGHWELALIILALVVGGVVTGYVLRGSQIAVALSTMQAVHLQEIERIQQVHRSTLALLASRIGVVVQEQAHAAGQVEQAARTAEQAASTARGAAANAARSAIRIREIPAEPEPEKTDPWAGRIEP